MLSGGLQPPVGECSCGSTALPGCEVVLSGGRQLADIRQASLLHECSHLISTPLIVPTNWHLLIVHLIPPTADPHLILLTISRLSEALKLHVEVYVRSMKIISLNFPLTLREEVNWPLCQWRIDAKLYYCFISTLTAHFHHIYDNFLWFKMLFFSKSENIYIC